MIQDCLTYQREPQTGDRLILERRVNGVMVEFRVLVIRVRLLRSRDLLVKYIREETEHDPKPEEFNLFFGLNCCDAPTRVKAWI
jgi:hypothetical protein